MIQTTGSADHLSYGDVAEIDLASALTILFWWKSPAFTSTAGLLAKPNNTGAFRVLEFPSSGKLTIQDATGRVENSGTEFTPSSLVHVGFVYDGSLAAASRMSIYANGVATGLTIITNFGATLGDGGANGLLIGQETTNNTNSTQGFGHLKIWNAALTADEVKREMYSYFPRHTANLVLWCPFDDEVLFGNYANTTYTATQTGTVTQITGGEPSLYGNELFDAFIMIASRRNSSHRTQRPHRGAFRQIGSGKLIPRNIEPVA